MDLLADRFIRLYSSYTVSRGDSCISVEAVFDDFLDNLLSDIRRDYDVLVSFSESEVYRELHQLEEFKGRVITIEISEDELQKLPFSIFLDWSDLVGYKPNTQSLPGDFVVLSEGDKYIGGEGSSQGVNNYTKLVRFISSFIDMADYREQYSQSMVGKVVFLHKSKLEIPILLDSFDVTSSLDGISIVDALLIDNSHLEQKKSILKEVLHFMLYNIPENDRFLFILENFGEFSNRFNENYQLFVSDFSFDKVRIEYEERKREYLLKINEVYSSLHTKMVGVPIALVVASSGVVEMVDVKSIFTNFLMFFASIMYGLMMFFLLKNQWHSLESIKTEYDGYMNRLKFNFFDQYEKIESIRRELDSRYVYQKGSIYMYSIALVVLALVVSGYFIWSLPLDFIVNY